MREFIFRGTVFYLENGIQKKSIRDCWAANKKQYKERVESQLHSEYPNRTEVDFGPVSRVKK